jgi:hypothetical protein
MSENGVVAGARLIEAVRGNELRCGALDRRTSCPARFASTPSRIMALTDLRHHQATAEVGDGSQENAD